MAAARFNDPLLSVLISRADDRDGSFSSSITVVAGAACTEGYVGSQRAYARYFDAAMSDGFTRAGEQSDDAEKQAAAKVFADAFKTPMTNVVDERDARRGELGEQLAASDVDDSAARSLRREYERLNRSGPGLVLRDARVWGPAFNPLEGPLEVPLCGSRSPPSTFGGSALRPHGAFGGVLPRRSRQGSASERWWCRRRRAGRRRRRSAPPGGLVRGWGRSRLRAPGADGQPPYGVGVAVALCAP